MSMTLWACIKYEVRAEKYVENLLSHYQYQIKSAWIKQAEINQW